MGTNLVFLLDLKWNSILFNNSVPVSSIFVKLAAHNVGNWDNQMLVKKVYVLNFSIAMVTKIVKLSNFSQMNVDILKFRKRKCKVKSNILFFFKREYFRVDMTVLYNGTISYAEDAK